MRGSPPNQIAARGRDHVLVALVLGFASALASMAVIPYVLALLPGLRAQIEVKVSVGVYVLLLIPLQALPIFFVLSWIGLRVGNVVGLGAPLLRSVISGYQRQAGWRRDLISSAVCGLSAGIVILILDKTIFGPLLPTPFSVVPDIPRWKGFLASFYGGIVEEVQLRLFVVSLLVWIVTLLPRAGAVTPVPATAPSSVVFWSAVVLAAVLFGAAHVPAAAQIWPMTPAVVTRVMLLNVLLGVLFGYLFWKRGLENAVAAHFAADIALHVVGGS